MVQHGQHQQKLHLEAWETQHLREKCESNELQSVLVSTYRLG